MVAERINRPAPPVGVIESISQGFETVASRLALLVLPLVVDLFLWLGPRISYANVELPSLASMPAQISSADVELAISRSDRSFPATQYWPVFPSLLGWEEAKLPPVSGYTPPVWQVQSTWDVMSSLLISLAITLTLSTPYMTLIGHQVADGHIHLSRTAMRMPMLLLQVALLAAIALVAMLIIMAPFALLAIILAAVAFALGSVDIANVLAVVTLQVGAVLVLWLGMFGVFTFHGMVINQRGLLGALWDSIRVVQWNVSGTLILLLVVMLLNSGLWALFRLVDPGTWMTPVAITAYAFASTALVSSTFIFFKDRYRYWREVRNEILADLARRRTEDRNHL